MSYDDHLRSADEQVRQLNRQVTKFAAEIQTNLLQLQWYLEDLKYRAPQDTRESALNRRFEDESVPGAHASLRNIEPGLIHLGTGRDEVHGGTQVKPTHDIPSKPFEKYSRPQLPDSTTFHAAKKARVASGKENIDPRSVPAGTSLTPPGSLTSENSCEAPTSSGSLARGSPTFQNAAPVVKPRKRFSLEEIEEHPNWNSFNVELFDIQKKDLMSASHVWKFWKVGTANQPSVEWLDRHYSRRMFCDSGDKKYLERRRHLVVEIEKNLAQGHELERVLAAADKKMKELGSLSKLCDLCSRNVRTDTPTLFCS